MDDLVSRVRAWLGIGYPDDEDHVDASRRLDEQARRVRLARIDAGLPARWDRRQTVLPDHPTRRATDDRT
jgi:hypothetical protein